MTLSNQPPSSDQPGYQIGTTPVAPVSVSSPLAPLVAEKKGSSALSLLLGFALVVAIGGVAFAAGRLTAPATATAAGTGRGGNGTGFGGGTGAAGPSGADFAGGGLAGAGLSVTGTVEAISPTSISVKLASGTTVQIPIDGATTYHGQAAATATDVTTGAQVVVDLNGTGGLGGGRGTGAAGGSGATGTSGSDPGGPAASGAAGASGGSGATRGTGGFGGRGAAGAIGPARDITIVTP